MAARTAVNLEVVDTCRQVDSLPVVFSRRRCNRRSQNLKSGIENCRVKLEAIAACPRSIRNPDFAQHISVVPAQLGDALIERTVVDAAFAELPVVIRAGDRLRASRAQLREC